ncbi:MFS transporter [Thermofilum pendens]|uniref:Major facilitator superfamily MFS_1 n=1 Tax=Thermofilum pendens (strain DSM 2475 / Hrk 5) TaxID=368408 RepID=A1S002_THEPD|nr:MFS transporter [Thermofilum pendens]ABL78782.1 major facilitator superfamily MFS_1 [Thermofilum pendens Hrk 5]
MSAERRFRFAVSYVPVFVARIGSGANTFLVAMLASGGDVAAGFVMAAYPLMEAIGALLAGSWSDFAGRKRTLIAGYVARSAGMLSLAAVFALSSSSPGSLVFAALEAALNGVVGFTTALILVSSLSMATDLTETGNRGLGMGGFEFVNLASYGAGYLLGSLLYSVLPGYPAYLAVALLTALATPVFAAFLEETRPPVPLVRRGLLSSLPRSALVLLPVWVALTTIIGIGIYAPRVIHDHLGAVHGPAIGKAGIGLLFLGALVLLGSGAVFFGRLSDSWGRVKVFRLGLAGGLAALSAMSVLLALGVDILRAAAAVAPLMFLTSAVGPTILALVGDQASTDARGRVMGVYSVVLGLGMGLGSILAGLASSALPYNRPLALSLVALAAYSVAALAHLYLERRLGGSL